MKVFLRILKWILLIVGVVGLAGLLYHFTRALYLSLGLDHMDEITAQDRTSASYQFLMMVASGLVMMGCAIGQSYIKINVFDFLKKNEK